MAREKTAMEIAQNAALCSVCRTPVRDVSATPTTRDGMSAFLPADVVLGSICDLEISKTTD